jgi:hypothetical protein
VKRFSMSFIILAWRFVRALENICICKLETQCKVEVESRAILFFNEKAFIQYLIFFLFYWHFQSLRFLLPSIEKTWKGFYKLIIIMILRHFLPLPMLGSTKITFSYCLKRDHYKLIKF